MVILAYTTPHTNPCGTEMAGGQTTFPAPSPKLEKKNGIDKTEKEEVKNTTTSLTESRIGFSYDLTGEEPAGVCQTEVFSGSGACYWARTTPQTWANALASCEVDGGTLAIVYDQATKTFLQQAFQSSYSVLE